MLLGGLGLAGCPPKEESAPDTKAQADGLYLAGTAAYLKGDLKGAHQHYAEVKKKNPADPRLAAAEGELYLAEAKLDDALRSFKEALKVDPKRATTWSRIGHIHSLQGRSQEAKQALKQALELNPRDFNALETLAEINLKEGNLDEAVKHLVAASLAAPDSARAGLVMRAAEELTQVGREGSALEILAQAVKGGSQSPEILSALGDRLAKVGRLAEAARVYSEAAKVSPADPTLWELVGELKMKLGQPEEAEVAFRESLKVSDRGVVHAALARLCQARKDLACTQRELNLALSKASGEEPRELIDIADLLASLGRKPDALKLLSPLAAEQESAGDYALQQKVAKLAKEVGDEVALRAARARMLDAGVRGSRER